MPMGIVRISGGDRTNHGPFIGVFINTEGRIINNRSIVVHIVYRERHVLCGISIGSAIIRYFNGNSLTLSCLVVNYAINRYLAARTVDGEQSPIIFGETECQRIIFYVRCGCFIDLGANCGILSDVVTSATGGDYRRIIH